VIGSLRGRLVDRDPRGEVLVEVGGVGYRVTVAPATLARLGEPGAEVFVWVHQHLREDASVLYGFAAKDERACFEALLGAHGVGPALALAILSVHGPVALRRALAEDDLAALCLVPGVGRKTAARLLVELKSRLDLDLDGAAEVAAIGGSVLVDTGPPSAKADVRAALAGLGYGPDEVRAALRELPDDGDPALLLRQALQVLAGARTA
jgi:Holliday junction DNA helicase RuvA